MSQKLTIRKFGPVSNLELDLKDLLIFIGSQATGKSTISKSVFFFKSLRDDLSSYLYQSYEQKQFDTSITTFAKQAKRKFIKIYGSVMQFPEMELKYQYGNGMEIAVKNQENRFTTIEFDSYFRNCFRDLVEQFQQVSDDIRRKSNPFSSSREISEIKTKEAIFFDNVNNQVNHLFDDDRDLLFLPAGRSLITTLSQQRYNIDLGDHLNNDAQEPESLIKLDYIMQIFINRIDITKQIFNSQPINDLIENQISNFDDNTESERERVIKLSQKLVNSILKGSYRYKDGTEWIDFGNNQSTLINFASSGQQEVIWILLLILLLILKNRPVFMVIEEPEAHLFPVAQKEIIDLISLLSNQSNNQIIVTTHSPYILSSFNNLLYANQLGEKEPEKVGKFVNKNLWIDPNRLDAYILEDGTARSIMDSDTHLIESAEIDRASDIIVDTFNHLFELDED